MKICTKRVISSSLDLEYLENVLNNLVFGHLSSDFNLNHICVIISLLHIIHELLKKIRKMF